MNASQAKATLKKRLSPGLYSTLSRISRKFVRSTNTPTDNLDALNEVGEPFASALRSMCIPVNLRKAPVASFRLSRQPQGY